MTKLLHEKVWYVNTTHHTPREHMCAFHTKKKRKYENEKYGREKLNKTHNATPPMVNIMKLLSC